MNPKTEHKKTNSKTGTTLVSMTGFAEKRVHFGDHGLLCRIRSVNHRFLDTKIRLPRGDFAALEAQLRKAVQAVIHRGAVEVSITYELSKTKTQQKKSLQTELAKAIALEARALAKNLKLKNADLTLGDILRIPGVLQSPTQNNGTDPDELARVLSEIEPQEIVSKLVTPTLESFHDDRIKEGRVLAKHIEGLLAEIKKAVDAILVLEPKEIERQRALLEERIQTALKWMSTDSVQSADFHQKLREEAAFWIEKRDFDEERVRFTNHLDSFSQALRSGETGVGRKLEFQHQELLREINTLGNKAQSHAISQHTVQIKTLLERIREQLANVE